MNFKLNKIINVKNVIIIMSWVGGEEETLCPLQQVLSQLPPELWDGLSSVLQRDSRPESKPFS